jgi:hypothetical protein
MTALEMTCDRCAVATTCPKRGASPLFYGGGKRVHCRILGGYGRQPVDKEILSSESLERYGKDGPCLTLADIPVLEDGQVSWETVKIFHQAVLGDRERPTAILGGQLNPKSPGS